MTCKQCGESELVKFKRRSSGYIPSTCYECEKKNAREARRARYADESTRITIKQQNAEHQRKKAAGESRPHVPSLYTPKPVICPDGIEKCSECERPAFSHGFCHSCVQKINPLDKYPWLSRICSPDSVAALRSSQPVKHLEVSCERCRSLSQVQLLSIVKTYDSEYLCNSCAHTGDKGASFTTVKTCIDEDATISTYGSMPSNIRQGMVVAKCEDCGARQHVKATSVINQARRHKAAGRTCIYKCFACGIKRPDVLAKVGEIRASQLKAGFKSALEVAMESRLQLLGLAYEHQYPIDMYSFDFFLPEHNVLLEVNGEYWHNLPENKPKDAAKATYISRYRKDLRLLVVEERHFFNPNLVDKILKEFIGLSPEIISRDFDLKSTVISSKSHGDAYIRFLDAYHYAKCGRKGKYVYEARLGDQLIAVCKFNSVTRLETAEKQGVKWTELLELDRFCIHPEFHKKNFATYFMSRCIKRVFSDVPSLKMLVSFADPVFGHPGVIYKAANWQLDGQTKESYHYIDSHGVPLNKKRVYDTASKLKMKELEYAAKHSLVRVDEPPKARFVFKKR